MDDTVKFSGQAGRTYNIQAYLHLPILDYGSVMLSFMCLILDSFGKEDQKLECEHHHDGSPLGSILAVPQFLTFHLTS
jgi:hypothetical protein